MSLNKIASLLRQNKFAALFDVPCGEQTVQWVSNGHALYPLEGLPYVEDRNLPALLSVAEKDLKKWRFTHCKDAPAGYCFSDDDPGERVVRVAPLTIGTNGEVLKPLLTGDRVIFVKYDYLLPVDSDANILFERETPGGARYIAVKEGLFLKALILPYDAFTSEMFTEQMEDMARLCRSTLTKRQWEIRRRGTARTGEGFVVDPETGEVVE